MGQCYVSSKDINELQGQKNDDFSMSNDIHQPIPKGADNKDDLPFATHCPKIYNTLSNFSTNVGFSNCKLFVYFK